MFVIAGYFVILFVVSNMYAYKMLNVNDDDFANNELMMEGIGNSAGVFFVSIQLVTLLISLVDLDYGLHLSLNYLLEVLNISED